MRERIESKHVTKEIKSQMPVIPVEIVKERGCTFCPYYLGNYEKQPRCMMKTCASVSYTHLEVIHNVILKFRHSLMERKVIINIHDIENVVSVSYTHLCFNPGTATQKKSGQTV